MKNNIKDIQWKNHNGNRKYLEMENFLLRNRRNET